MAKDFNNRLITPELEKAMQDYPLYSQDNATKFGLGKVRVEQRKPFQPCQLSEIFDRELQSFLSRLYD